MKVHQCDELRCHKIIPFKYRYCHEHWLMHRKQWLKHRSQAQPTQEWLDARHRYYKYYNQYKRNEVADAFYQSPRWRRVRSYVQARDEYRSGVTGKVITDHDLIVDHIIPRRLCHHPLDARNLWCLSRGEHAIKTKIEQSIAEQPNGDKKLQHLSREWWQKVIKEKIGRHKNKFSF